MKSRTLLRHQALSSNLHIWHERKDDSKQTPTKCRQDRNDAVQFLKTQVSTCTSFDLSSHHFLLWLSQKPWFIPRQGSLCERTSRKSDVFVLFATISQTKPPKPFLLISYSHALTIYCNSLLAELLQSLVGELQRVQNCAARLVVRAPPRVYTTPIFRHLHWLPVRAWISHKTANLCFNTITSSSPAYLSDLLHLYSPRSIRSSADTRLPKISFYKCKTKGDRARAHCHCTLEMLQLSTPPSLI